MNNGSFQFALKNSKEAIEKSTDRHSGIGLSNVQRRLDLLYPGKHQLSIRNEMDTFNVDLSIKT
jgi:two-component system, LytTR family, sensor kinase